MNKILNEIQVICGQQQNDLRRYRSMYPNISDLKRISKVMLTSEKAKQTHSASIT